MSPLKGSRMLPVDLQPYSTNGIAGFDRKTGLPFPAVIPSDMTILGAGDYQLELSGSQLCRLFWMEQQLQFNAGTGSVSPGSGVITADMKYLFNANVGSIPGTQSYQNQYPYPSRRQSLADVAQWGFLINDGFQFSVQLIIQSQPPSFSGLLANGTGKYYPFFRVVDVTSDGTVSTLNTGDNAGTFELLGHSIDMDYAGSGTAPYGAGTTTFPLRWP